MTNQIKAVSAVLAGLLALGATTARAGAMPLDRDGNIKAPKPALKLELKADEIARCAFQGGPNLLGVMKMSFYGFNTAKPEAGPAFVYVETKILNERGVDTSAQTEKTSYIINWSEGKPARAQLEVGGLAIILKPGIQEYKLPYWDGACVLNDKLTR